MKSGRLWLKDEKETTKVVTPCALDRREWNGRVIILRTKDMVLRTVAASSPNRSWVRVWFDTWQAHFMPYAQRSIETKVFRRCRVVLRDCGLGGASYLRHPPTAVLSSNFKFSDPSSCKTGCVCLRGYGCSFSQRVLSFWCCDWSLQVATEQSLC